MNTQEIVKKLAELLYMENSLYNGVIHFDWSSYEFDGDIPTLKIDDRFIKFEEFRVNKEGTEIVVICGDDSYTLDLTKTSYTEQDFEDMGMYEFLSNVYYETEHSWEIGDFEIDFLGINN